METQYNDVFNELQYYILNDNNIRKTLCMKLYSNHNNNNNNNNNKIKPNNDTQKSNINNSKKNKKLKIFIPKERDTLFWCFYILKNGDTKYETINHKNDVIASQLKIEYIEKIRKNKQTVKTYKFDTISNIESNLANDSILNIKTFLTLCAIENINVLIVNNKTYYELLMNDTSDIYVLYCLENKGKGNYEKKYGFELSRKEDIDNNLKPNLYRVENIDKPIKSISAYKVDDLLHICNTLGIPTVNHQSKKQCKTKTELYEGIIQYF
jgi:hypothetical protein